MAVANQNPENVLNYVVNFTTTNVSDGQIFEEPHTVSGPNGAFTIPLNAVSISGSKIVVPLTTNTAPGAYYLKLHLPQPGSSKFYVTFAQKNNSMADGYYDYITGIPTDYRSSLRTFIADGITTFPTQPTTYSKSLVFTVYGLDTNQVANAVQYTVRLSAVFGAVATR
jgi:hypothetical protein